MSEVRKVVDKTFGASRNFRSEQLRVMQTQVSKRFFSFFYLGFLSRTFTNNRTAGEGGGHFFNSSLPLPPTPQALRH